MYMYVYMSRATYVQLDEARLHDVAAALREGHVELLVQERVALQHDLQVVDALVQRVAHGLGQEDREHEGDDVVEAPRELQHDDHQRDGHPRDAGEHGGGSHHGVDPWVDAVAEELVTPVQVFVVSIYY